MLNNLIDSILVWFRLRKLKAKKIISQRMAKAIEEAKKNIKVEEKLACNHTTLKAVIEGNYFYKCQDCGLVTILTPSFVWEKDGFKGMVKELSELENGKKDKN